MKRTRKQTIRRGNLSGRQRRRLASLVKSVRDCGQGHSVSVYRFHTPGMFRDACRLHHAGTIVAVASRPSWCLDGTPRELQLFLTLEAARRRYPKWAIMKGRSVGARRAT